MREPERDLFGEVRVTLHDIDAWMSAVPRIDPGSPRAAWYARAYDVANKIRAAKLAGTFETQTTVREHPAPWWHRFNWR